MNHAPFFLVGALLLTRNASSAQEIAERQPVFLVGQQTGLVEPSRGLGRADFVAPVAFEPFLQMKIDGVEIGHESLCFVGDAEGGLPDGVLPCQ